MTRVRAVLRTNLPAACCTDEFMKNIANFLSEKFQTDCNNIALEVHTDVRMLLSCSTDPTMNVDIHHNAGDLDTNRRVGLAEDLADCVSQHLHISKRRTLVLFFDTQKCT